MQIEGTEGNSTVDDEKIVPPETEEEKKSEEEPKDQEEKDDFAKTDDLVPGSKYNQALRKAREAEMEKRELEKRLQDTEKALPKKEKEEKEDDDEDFDFEDDEEEEKKKPRNKEVDVEALVDARVKPLVERISQREAEERKNQRDAFFKEHPEYLSDSRKWQELLDELDNSFNPNSKDSHYKQLTKAHRIISAEDRPDPEIEKKKREMASDAASKGDGAEKAADRKSDLEAREDRLARRMPKGFVYTDK